MSISIKLDVMLAKRKMRSKELAAQMGITEQSLSTLKTQRALGIRFATLDKLCTILECTPNDIIEYRQDNAHDDSQN
jgi:Predicted transcriptional regulator